MVWSGLRRHIAEIWKHFGCSVCDGRWRMVWARSKELNLVLLSLPLRHCAMICDLSTTHLFLLKKLVVFRIVSSRSYFRTKIRSNKFCLSAIAKMNEYILLWCRTFCDTSAVESFRYCRRPLHWDKMKPGFEIFFVVRFCRCCSKMYQKVTVYYTRRDLLLLLSVLVASNSILGSLASTAAKAAGASL